MNALRKPDVEALFAPPPLLSEVEVLELYDRLQLQVGEEELRRFVAHAERQQRLLNHLKGAKGAFLAAFRRPGGGSAGIGAAEAAARLRYHEALLRREWEAEKPRYLSLRRACENRSPVLRAALIPTIDRYMHDIPRVVAEARNEAVEVTALSIETLADAAGEEPVETAVLAVGRMTDLGADLPPAQRRKVMERLRKLARFPRAPQLQLTPVGVTHSIWAALVAPNTAALLRHRRGEERDALVAVGLEDFRPVEGDDLSSLAGEAGWRLEDERLVIVPRRRPERLGDWVARMAGEDSPGEAIGDERGREAVDW